MKVSWKAIVVLLVTVFLLVFLFKKEGFQAGMPGIRCGVDLSTCSSGTQCMNGFCGKMDKPQLLANQLPVFP